MLNSRAVILLAMAFFTLLSACSGFKETGEYHPIDAEGWAYGDTVHFNIESPDSVIRGDIAVVVRHTAAYPYSNIWLEINYPQQDKTVSDSVNIVLADDFGNWLGRGAGLSFQRVDTVLRDVTLSTPTDVTLRHIMRVDRLSDIEQLGVVFIPYETHR
ncbi:MAG: gliding motility lipoprotein GldH [Muribaculaceae bacterium]|nr:gliding motility lipoprotein GldH [Muribaculaceae bacterium]